MAAPVCTPKTVLFKQAQNIENQAGTTVVGNSGSVDTANATFNSAEPTTHQKRLEMLLVLILEVLVDIREGSSNPT